MRKKWRKMKREAKRNYTGYNHRYVYEVPEPEHIFIKISDTIVYDVNDKTYYKSATEFVDKIVSGYTMDIGYLAGLRNSGIIGKLI